MSVLMTITEGWTKRLGPFNLKNNGESIDLTGTTVRLLLRSSASADWVDVEGDVQVDPDQVANKGDVYYTPDAADFRALHGPYYVRFEVEDSEGISYFPNGDPDSIVVKQK